MQLKKSLHKTLYIISGLVLCSLVLTGLAFVFVQTFENTYKEQAFTTLNAASLNIAQALHNSSSDNKEYLETVADNLAYALSVDTTQNVEKSLEQALRFAKKFGFLGYINVNKKLHLASRPNSSVAFDDRTKELLLSTREHLYAMGYVDGVGEYLYMYTTPIRYQNKYFGVLFSGTEHSGLREVFLPKTIGREVSFSILDSNGTVLDGTMPAMSLGENALVVWASSLENQPTVIRRLSHSIKIGRQDFEKISMGSVSYYLSFTPTPNQGLMVVTSIPESAISQRLSNIAYVIFGAAFLWIFFCGIIVYFIVRTMRKDRKQAEHYANRLQWLFDEIPCGVVRFNDDACWTVLDYGRSLLTILNLTGDELKSDYDNCWSTLVHPKDIWSVRNSLQSLHVEGQEFAIIEYRLLLKDSTVIWILETTRCMEDSSGRWYWSIITNITERKKSELHNQKTSERYKHIFENFEKILYEYDWVKKELRTTQQFFKKFLYPLPNDNNDYHAVSIAVIHPDDLENFEAMQYALQTGKKTAEQLVRIKNADGIWFWCQMRQNAWVDHDENMVKAIGEIKNVDEETRSLQKLRDDVQRDAFTGLYNKIATADLICREISLESTQRGVLCIVDVDNFKMVNDNLGHACGDAVIKDLSNGLSSIFRSDDIVGRIGGDEFLVYIKNMPKLGALLVKLDNVLKFFRQTLREDGMEVSISCSIGIALFPKDGMDYEQLYHNADKALYRSKKRKGIYTFYDAKVDG